MKKQIVKFMFICGLSSWHCYCYSNPGVLAQPYVAPDSACRTVDLEYFPGRSPVG